MCRPTRRRTCAMFTGMRQRPRSSGVHRCNSRTGLVAHWPAVRSRSGSSTIARFELASRRRSDPFRTPVRIDNIACLNVGATMRRREFIKLLGGAATAWAVSAHTPQLLRPRHIGVLMAFNETDVRAKNWLALFDSELTKLGWSGERKPQVDVRWAGDSVERMQAFAKELVALRPDVILSFGTPVTAALQRETQTIPIVFAIDSDPVVSAFV